jgi:epoxyqueuosine reductase QueG
MKEQVQIQVDAFQNKLETMAHEQGADYFGVADLTPAREFIETQGGAAVAGFPRAISIGMRLFDGLVEMIEPKTEFNISPYRQNIYNVVSPRLDDISLNLARMLRDQGYNALPVPQGFSGPNKSILSYKLPAHLAGHGWIGKSCLLVTPEFGPRVRFSAVLTDAPLDTGRPMEENCEDCRICVDECPVRAFTGRPFQADEPREARFDPGKCARFRGSQKRTPGQKTYACGMCVKVCPHGTLQQKK